MLVAPFALALALAAAPKPASLPAMKAAPAARAAQLPLARQIEFGRKRFIGELAPTPSTTSKVPLAVGGPADENVLKNVKLAVADDALLDFFRKRTPPAMDRGKIAELVKKLSAEEKDRDAAQATLIAVGPPAMPLLRTAANNTDDPEGLARARVCMENIEGANAANIVINAARLLASKKPAGACEVLIGYLPYAEDEQTYAEVEHALISVAVRDGKADPAIIAALKDNIALRRASAAHALAQAGGTAQYSIIRPLLRDEKASVRLKAALGLVGAYDAEAIPVLIGLMGELPGPQRETAETYLTNLAGEWAVAGPKANDATSRRLRREVWDAWWKGVDPVKIMGDLKERMATDEEHEQIQKAIEHLDDSVEDVRKQASTQLINMGRKASAQLRRAISEGNPKISPAAARCLDAIEKDTPNPLPMAASRILALRRPEGTVKALIEYLPFADTEEASQQIIDLLGVIGIAGTKGDEALVKALEDKLAVRRAAAITALTRGKATDHMDVMRKLLTDKDNLVKLRAAQGLATMGQKKAISTLIVLLKDLPLDQCWEAEDFLSRVAGEKAPNEMVSSDEASRTKAVTAWAKWWEGAQKTIDLTKIDLGERDMGYYLVVENYNPLKGNGRVLEMDGTGKIRWEIGGLSGPYDAQVIRGGNVLVIENQNRVTERDRTGKIAGFDKYFPSVFYLERLRDGNTFIACRQQLQMLDSKGNAKWTHTYNQNSIIAARTFRDGTSAYISYSGHFVKLDKDGKQVKTFQLNWANYSINGAQILENENVLVSVSNFNKVKEYRPDNKVVWEADVTYPLIPHRLKNGNTVVSANSSQSIVELDPRGKVLKTITLPQIRPYRVTKR